MSSRVADKAVQIHGGYGYMSESRVARYVRDAKLLEIGAGTSEIRRMLIGRGINRSGVIQKLPPWGSCPAGTEGAPGSQHVRGPLRRFRASSPKGGALGTSFTPAPSRGALRTTRRGGSATLFVGLQGPHLQPFDSSAADWVVDQRVLEVRHAERLGDHAAGGVEWVRTENQARLSVLLEEDAVVHTAR